jgi:hypothetical protein
MKRLLPLLFPLVLFAASCSPGTEGIFASIEREQKVQSLGGMNKYATITSMAEMTSVTPHRYFATGGQALFTRNYGVVQWDKTTVGGYSTVAAVGTVGAFGSEKAFAIANGQLWVTSDGATWNTVSVGTDTPYDLIPIRDNGGQFNSEILLVTFHNEPSTNQPSYQYVYKIDTSGSVTGPVNLLVGSAASLNGLSSNVSSAVNDGSNYYLVNQNYLWKIASFSGSAVQISVSSTDGWPTHNLQGILFLSSSNTLYLSTMSNANNGGAIYSITYTPPSVATSFAFTPLATGISKNSYPVWFTQFLYNQRNTSLWIATYASTYVQGTGYMEYASGSLSTTPNTSENNYNSTVLPTSAVGVLYADHESAPNYFLGTLAQGLWQWSGSGSSATWVQQ